MNKSLVFTLLAALSVLSLGARDNGNRSSSTPRHAWGTPLTMEEFASDKPLRDTSDFRLTWKILYERESKRKGLTKVTYFKSKLYLDEKNSWIDLPYRNENVLRFCQLAFDYAELYRRKEYEEWAGGKKSDYAKLTATYRDKRNETIRVARSVTRCGEDTAALRFYETELAHELSQTQEVNYLDHLDQYVGECAGLFHASFGPYLECGQNDYFDIGKPFGLSMRCGFDVYGHLFLLDFSGSVSEGKCKRASGKINKGEAVGNTSLLFTYGYCQTPQARNRLYATASVGKRAFMIAKEKSDEKPRSCSGVDLGFGFLYEIPIYQNFMLHGTSQIGENVSSSMHCLYIKPQFDLYHNKQSSCWATAASLSIGYSWSLRGYERKK